MKKKGFSIVKFLTYLTVGLCILGGWGYVNYTNYTVKEQRAQVISENVTIINEVVEEIETEQQMLRMEQRVAPPSEPMPSRFPMLSRESAPLTAVAPSPPNTSSRFDALEARILELEEEKEVLKAEKTDIKNQVTEMLSIFKLDYESPLVNAIVIPVILYFMKKMFDLIFARIEERLHHRFEEECEDEA